VLALADALEASASGSLSWRQARAVLRAADPEWQGRG
jgi:hypothetical protein